MLYFNALAYIKGFKGSVLTNSSSGIQHAWHFWYALVSVLKCHAVASVLRASPLNWALGARRYNENLYDVAVSFFIFRLGSNI